MFGFYQQGGAKPIGNLIIHISKIVTMKFKVIIKEGEDGWYVVEVPTLPGCISQGRTKKEALGNIKEAIELYLEPEDDLSIVSTGQVAEVTV